MFSLKVDSCGVIYGCDTSKENSTFFLREKKFQSSGQCSVFTFSSVLKTDSFEDSKGF